MACNGAGLTGAFFSSGHLLEHVARGKEGERLLGGATGYARHWAAKANERMEGEKPWPAGRGREEE